MTDEPFAFIDLPAARSRTKPRRSGLTMMADFGMTLEHTESILGLSASYVDFAKIAVGTARLYSRSYLTQKLELSERHAVRPFIGGQFAEYVLATQGRQALPRWGQPTQRLPEPPVTLGRLHLEVGRAEDLAGGALEERVRARHLLLRDRQRRQSVCRDLRRRDLSP